MLVECKNNLIIFANAYILVFTVDVEDFAKLLYDTLTKELPELDEIGVTKMTADLREMVHDNIFLAGIKCPSPNEVNLRHLNAIWDMTNG